MISPFQIARETTLLISKKMYSTVILANNILNYLNVRLGIIFCVILSKDNLGLKSANICSGT